MGHDLELSIEVSSRRAVRFCRFQRCCYPRPAQVLGWWVCVLLGLLRPGPALAESAAAWVPSDKQAVLMLRLLAYDRRVVAGAAAPVVVAVLEKGPPAEAQPECSDVAHALDGLAMTSSVRRRRVKVVRLSYRDGPKLAADLGTHAPAAVYVCPALADVTKAIANAAMASATLTFAGSEEQVKVGLGVGFVREGDRAAVVVNLRTTAAVGAEFESKALGSARVVVK